MVLLRKISRRRRLADIRLYLFSKSPSSLSFFPRGEIAKEGSKIIPGERSILATIGETSLDPPSVAASASPRCCCCCCTVIEALKAAAMEEGEGEGERHCRKLFFFSHLSFFRKALSSSLPHSLLLALRKFFALLIKTL